MDRRTCGHRVRFRAELGPVAALEQLETCSGGRKVANGIGRVGGVVRLSRGPRTSAELFDAGMLGPALPGAACRGRAPGWDLDVAGETAEQQQQRLTSAAEVCRTSCRAFVACAAALPDVPRSFAGVWAGEVRRGVIPRPNAQAQNERRREARRREAARRSA